MHLFRIVVGKNSAKFCGPSLFAVGLSFGLMRAMPWALICFCFWLEDWRLLSTSKDVALPVGDGAGHGLEWP